MYFSTMGSKFYDINLYIPTLYHRTIQGMQRLYYYVFSRMACKFIKVWISFASCNKKTSVNVWLIYYRPWRTNAWHLKMTQSLVKVFEFFLFLFFSWRYLPEDNNVPKIFIDMMLHFLHTCRLYKCKDKCIVYLEIMTVVKTGTPLTWKLSKS